MLYVCIHISGKTECLTNRSRTSYRYLDYYANINKQTRHDLYGSQLLYLFWHNCIFYDWIGLRLGYDHQGYRYFHLLEVISIAIKAERKVSLQFCVLFKIGTSKTLNIHKCDLWHCQEIVCSIINCVRWASASTDVMSGSSFPQKQFIVILVYRYALIPL